MDLLGHIIPYTLHPHTMYQNHIIPFLHLHLHIMNLPHTTMNLFLFIMNLLLIIPNLLHITMNLFTTMLVMITVMNMAMSIMLFHIIPLLITPTLTILPSISQRLTSLPLILVP